MTLDVTLPKWHMGGVHPSPEAPMPSPLPRAPLDVMREAQRLRYEAWLAHLDGRNGRARQLNKDADRVERAARALRIPFTAGQPLCEPTP